MDLYGIESITEIHCGEVIAHLARFIANVFSASDA